MATNDKNCCAGCYWSDKCLDGKTDCDEYTPLDTEDDDVKYYNRIIKENTEEYAAVINEYAD